MPVEVYLSGTLRGFVQNYDLMNGLQYNHGCTVEQLLAGLGVPSDQVRVVMVNRQTAKNRQVLEDGDKVGLFSAIGGG